MAARRSRPGRCPPSRWRTSGAELPALAQVALDLAEPASEPVRLGERRPQVIDVGVEPVLEPNDAGAVRGAQGAQGRRWGLWVVTSTPSFTLAACDLGVQGVQTLVPRREAAGQPVVDLGKRLGRNE